jgi:hypothetical protein
MLACSSIPPVLCSYPPRSWLAPVRAFVLQPCLLCIASAGVQKHCFLTSAFLGSAQWYCLHQGHAGLWAVGWAGGRLSGNSGCMFRASGVTVDACRGGGLYLARLCRLGDVCWGLCVSFPYRGSQVLATLPVLCGVLGLCWNSGVLLCWG